MHNIISEGSGIFIFILLYFIFSFTLLRHGSLHKETRTVKAFYIINYGIDLN